MSARDAIVHIAVVKREHDYDNPWQSRTTTEAGSAFFIAPRQLLTAAHIVADARQIRVRGQRGRSEWGASVRAVSHDRDLALLDVIGPHDELAVAPLELGALPGAGQELDLIGCTDAHAPLVARGVVAKLAVERYTHSQRQLPLIAVEADIEGDHGGGPAVAGGRVVGLVCQHKTDEAVCELVPATLIRAFLDGVRAGRSPVVPALGFASQPIANDQLRRLLDVPAGTAGVAVIDVDHGGSADGALHRGDVVTAIAGRPIAAGMIDYPGVSHAMRFDGIVGEHHVGDRVALDVHRRGRVELALQPWQPLVARARYDAGPRFLVLGGLVFQPLTRDYLTTWDSWWNTGPKEFLDLYYRGRRTPAQHEVVVLTRVLQDEVNAGYEHLYNEAVASVNGRLPRDFDDFVAMVTGAHGLLRIETTSGGLVAFETERIRAASDRILARYDVPRDRG